jgi:hypothetical protein
MRLALVAVIGASIVTVAGVGTFAGLNATATATQSQSAGTLSLTSANNGVGFSQAVSNLAPGDVVNRYVNLTNGGSLDAQGLSLTVSATGTATLITDGVARATNKAITVAVKSCSGAWNASTGACSGSISTEIAATPLSTFASAQNFATTSTLDSLDGLNLQIQVTLPDQNETTADGVAPATTIQDGSVALTYEFFEAQRTATTTNS